jgi:uncharacterized protein (DUF433 family)
MPYPFATKKFATDGRNLLSEEGQVWQNALAGQQQAFFEEVGRRLVHVGDFTSCWRPLGVERAVVLDPQRSFGKPIDDLSGAHTFVIAEALAAGDPASKVVWWYGTTAQAVADAAEFEKEWQGPSAKRIVHR